MAPLELAGLSDVEADEVEEAGVAHHLLHRRAQADQEDVAPMMAASVREVLKTRRISWRSSMPQAIARRTAAITAACGLPKTEI